MHRLFCSIFVLVSESTNEKMLTVVFQFEYSSSDGKMLENINLDTNVLS
jgi:hypothetical protein